MLARIGRRAARLGQFRVAGALRGCSSSHGSWEQSVRIDSLEDFFDYCGFFGDLVENDLIASDLAWYRQAGIFVENLRHKELREVDVDEFVEGASQAFRVTHGILSSRDYWVHAVHHANRGNDVSKELTALLGDEEASRKGFNLLQDVMSNQLFETSNAQVPIMLMMRLIAESDPTKIQMKQVDLRRCCIVGMRCFSFANRYQREEFFAAPLGIEPMSATLPQEELEVEMQREEPELWARMDVKVAFVDTYDMAQPDPEQPSSIVETPGEAELVFLGCLEGPEPLEWKMVAMEQQTISAKSRKW
mmetsp:Transcript_12266/g.45457  ORF Transcript_12266/g.45457 Transcript_12266/m.45457 type:complete len:304 (-) Transcript_12266:73-984(-)